MDGADLKSILEVVYGENVLVHILNGKAVTTAFRWNLLVDNCRYQLLLQSILDDNSEFTPLIIET